MIHYPWTRHKQRYEYVLMRGWVSEKTVADIGAGTCEGALSLSAVANLVYVVDLVDDVNKVRNIWVPTTINCRPDKLVPVQESIFDFVGKVDVAVAIEVFEHMPDPQQFIDHLAIICRNLFITTPLALVTKRARNEKHIAEYSVKDFEGIVGSKFDILERKYQLSDLQIVDEPQYAGDSIDMSHTVQMLWCEVKK